jgi:lysyl-tRNA synthetase class 2
MFGQIVPPNVPRTMAGYRRSGPETPLDSTTIASVGYDPETLVFEMEFRSGAIYRYHLVPSAVYRGLLAAPSKGRFFNQCIRLNFACESVASRASA